MPSIPPAETSWYQSSEKDDTGRMSMTPPKFPSLDSSSMSSDQTIADASGNIDLESLTAVRTTAGTSSCAPVDSRGFLSRISGLDLKPSSQTTEDAVMGTSDGMTVPFALTASLAGVVPNARYVMLAGLAELTAGAISMALGGLLQANCEAESYEATARDTHAMVTGSPDEMDTIINDLYAPWNFSPDTLTLIKRDLRNNGPKSQTDFVLRFYHERSKPDNRRRYKSASTLGACYFLAGLLGLLPYIFVPKNHIKTGLYASIGIEAVALYAFGYVKTAINVGWRSKENIWKALKGAVYMVLVGAIAASVAVGLITGVNKGQHITG